MPHLLALQKHILRCLLFFALMVMLSLWFAPQIVRFLQTPIAAYFPEGLGISGPGEIMDLIPRLALVSALFLSLPYILFEAYLFAAPGLMPRTRWIGILVVPEILLLFVVGMTFSFYILLPAALGYLVQVSDLYGIIEWSLASYLSFASKVMFTTQFMLFAPLIATGFMVLRRVRFHARYILVGAFLFAAMLTPGSMVVLDLGLTLLIFVLAGISYLLARLLFWRRASTGV